MVCRWMAEPHHPITREVPDSCPKSDVLLDCSKEKTGHTQSFHHLLEHGSRFELLRLRAPHTGKQKASTTAQEEAQPCILHRDHQSPTPCAQCRRLKSQPGFKSKPMTEKTTPSRCRAPQQSCQLVISTEPRHRSHI